MIFCYLFLKATKFLTLNNDIKYSFKKLSLLFRQAEMVFAIFGFSITSPLNMFHR